MFYQTSLDVPAAYITSHGTWLTSTQLPEAEASAFTLSDQSPHPLLLPDKGPILSGGGQHREGADGAGPATDRGQVG